MFERYYSEPIFQNFKRIAESGKGEYGRQYDRGVLDVFEDVELDGFFYPNRWCGAVMAFATDWKNGVGILTEGETEVVKDFLRTNRLSVEDAVLYVRGVDAAQNVLAPFRKELSTDMVSSVCCTPCPAIGCGARCIRLKHDDNAHQCQNSHQWQGPRW